MAFCKDESCGLARMTSDGGIVRSLGVSGKRSELCSPAPPGVPPTRRQQQRATCGESCKGERTSAWRVVSARDYFRLKLRVLGYAAYS